MKLTDADLLTLARLSKAINRTAYHGGLGLEESGQYLGVLDRILEAHGTWVDKLVPHVPRSEDEMMADVVAGIRRSCLDR